MMLAMFKDDEEAIEWAVGRLYTNPKQVPASSVQKVTNPSTHEDPCTPWEATESWRVYFRHKDFFSP